MKSESTSAVGRRAEDAVAAWYAARGWSLLDRNWRAARGEVDLVVRKGRTVAFCEVKARFSHAFGSPFEAATSEKQRRLRRVATAWLAAARAGGTLGRGPCRVRFDVAGVTDAGVEVLEGAF